MVLAKYSWQLGKKILGRQWGKKPALALGKIPSWNQGLVILAEYSQQPGKNIPGKTMRKKAWIGFSLLTPRKTGKNEFCPVWLVLATSCEFYSDSKVHHILIEYWTGFHHQWKWTAGGCWRDFEVVAILLGEQRCSKVLKRKIDIKRWGRLSFQL